MPPVTVCRAPHKCSSASAGPFGCRLFAPTVVSWLANHPLSPGFELKAGTLCVFLPRPLEDAGNLTYLIDATRYLAARVASEVGEEMARPA